MSWKLKYRCKACGYEAEVYEGRGLFPLTMQGQCEPNAESSLYAEVQPVLAISIAKLRQESLISKKSYEIFTKLLRQRLCFTTKAFHSSISCRKTS